MPVLWVYQLVAKPVLLAGHLAALFLTSACQDIHWQQSFVESLSFGLSVPKATAVSVWTSNVYLDKSQPLSLTFANFWAPLFLFWKVVKKKNGLLPSIFKREGVSPKSRDKSGVLGPVAPRSIPHLLRLCSPRQAASPRSPWLLAMASPLGFQLLPGWFTIAPISARCLQSLGSGSMAPSLCPLSLKVVAASCHC